MVAGRAGRPPKVLLVKSRGRSSMDLDERLRHEKAGNEPRSMLLEEVLGCDVLDESTVAEMTGWRGVVYGLLPPFLGQAIEATLRSGSYDIVVTWSERHTVALAAIFACLRVRTPHLALMFWMSKPVVRVPLKVFRSGIDRVITWSSVQRNAAIADIGFRHEEIVLVHHPVDLEFFKPVAREREILFAAGSTQRDFSTFVEATRELEIPIRIAASLVVAHNGVKTTTHDVRAQFLASAITDVEVRPMNSVELRDSYAQSKAVIVPLLPSNIDAGVNVILEGMAMGRPVIASRTVGQVDVIVDGVNGLLVEPGDIDSLRQGIQSILADPVAAAAMGLKARAYVEKYHRLEDFVEHVRKNAFELTVDGSQNRGYRKLFRVEPRFQA